MKGCVAAIKFLAVIACCSMLLWPTNGCVPTGPQCRSQQDCSFFQQCSEGWCQDSSTLKNPCASASASCHWLKRWGGATDDSVRDLAVTPDGYIYAVGTFTKLSNFGSHLLETKGEIGSWVAKFDSQGKILWLTSLEGVAVENDTVEANTIAIDKQENVYIAAIVKGTFQVGSQTLKASGIKEVLVTKLDSTGKVIWSWVSSGNATMESSSIAVNDKGFVYLTGGFTGTVKLGSHTLQTAGAQDTDQFLIKLDPKGTCLWARHAGEAGESWGVAAATDAKGYVYTTGYFRETASFGAYTLTSAGGYDLFVTRHDSDGKLSWAARFGGTDNEEGGQLNDGEVGYAITVSPSGDDIYVAGRFTGTFPLGTFSLQARQARDLFITRLNGNAKPVWALLGQSGGSARIDDMKLDSQGGLFVTGFFLHNVAGGSKPTQQSELLLSKIDTKQGVFAWAMKAPNTKMHGGINPALGLDRWNNIYVAGSFTDTFQIEGKQIKSDGGLDAFIFKRTAP